MAEGKDKKMWDGWSALLTLQANCNIDSRKTKPHSIDRFHPYLSAPSKTKSKALGISEAVSSTTSVLRKQKYKGL